MPQRYAPLCRCARRRRLPCLRARSSRPWRYQLRQTRRWAGFAKTDGVGKVIDRHRGRARSGSPTSIRLAADPVRPFDGRHARAESRVPDARPIWPARPSGTPISPPGIMGRLGQAILAWEKFRLGSDMPSRMLPKLTFQAWGRKVPDHRTPFDWLSRDRGGGRQIYRGPALRLGCVGLHVAGHFRHDLCGCGRPQLCLDPQESAVQPVRRRRTIQRPIGGMAVEELADAHAPHGLFESRLQGLAGDPPRRLERHQSRRDHGGRSWNGLNGRWLGR